MSDSKTLTVRIWLLERNSNPIADEWARVVVAASSEQGAREAANYAAGSEGYVWTDGMAVSAKAIGDATEDVQAGVIMFSRE